MHSEELNTELNDFNTLRSVDYNFNYIIIILYLCTIHVVERQRTFCFIVVFQEHFIGIVQKLYFRNSFRSLVLSENGTTLRVSLTLFVDVYSQLLFA